MLQKHHLNILVTSIIVKYTYTLATEWVGLKAVQDQASILNLRSHTFSRIHASARLPQFETWPLFTSWLSLPPPQKRGQLLFRGGLYSRKYSTLLNVYALLQSVHPIRKCALYYKVYTLLQSVYPIIKCVPYYKVCTLLQSVLPITMCAPYYKVYTLDYKVCTYSKMCSLLQSMHRVPPITRCAPYYKVYTLSLLQSVHPITKCIPYFCKYRSVTKCTPIRKYLILTLITPHRGLLSTLDQHWPLAWAGVISIFIVHTSSRLTTNLVNTCAHIPAHLHTCYSWVSGMLLI